MKVANFTHEPKSYTIKFHLLNLTKPRNIIMEI